MHVNVVEVYNCLSALGSSTLITSVLLIADDYCRYTYWCYLDHAAELLRVSFTCDAIANGGLTR